MVSMEKWTARPPTVQWGPLCAFSLVRCKCSFLRPAAQVAAFGLREPAFLNCQVLQNSDFHSWLLPFSNIFMPILNKEVGADYCESSETWTRPRRGTGNVTTVAFLVYQIKISHRSRNWISHLPHWKSRSLLREVVTSLQVSSWKIESFF